jgi:lyso-ornithine lipid O-acyltransferase
MASLSIARSDPLGKIRFALRALWLSVALIIVVGPHYLWSLFRIPSPWPRLYLVMAARACGARVKVIGTPLKRDVFFVANHLSWLDIPVLGCVTGCAFVSQDKIAKWPVFGWMARRNYTVFVSRTDRFAVGDQIEVLRGALAEHKPIAIFPEGTTTDGRSLLPFKPSLFEVLVPPPRPMMIQPVVLDYDPVGPEIAWIGEQTAPESAMITLTRKGSFPVRLHFLEPFDPGDHPDRKRIAAEARKRIAAALSASLKGLPIV